MNPKALYTDGIGIIAHGFAKELSEQMNLDFIPSAFQIRFGGYKGNFDFYGEKCKLILFVYL
jgi:hypothetical protein